MDETEAQKRERLRDERMVEGMAEAARLERDYKQATILLSKQMPELISEMDRLRAAIDRKR